MKGFSFDVYTSLITAYGHSGRNREAMVALADGMKSDEIDLDGLYL